MTSGMVTDLNLNKNYMNNNYVEARKTAVINTELNKRGATIVAL